MDFHFQHSEYLAFLALLPLLLIIYWQVIFWKKKTIKKIGDERLVKEMTRSYSPANFLVKFLFVMLALGAVIAGAANLQKPGAMDQVQRKGVDLMIAMDVSKSMLAEDIKPNRLEMARQIVYKLMDQLPDDRIGLVFFAGRAYLQMPLTTDHGAARMYIQQASPDIVPTQGTVIADAMRMSAMAFNSKERKFKAMVLITDGEDHDPEAMTLAKQLEENGIMVNTIGIGSPEGSIIPDPNTNGAKKDESGNIIISKLNEPELQQLATTTKGVYTRGDNIDASVQAIIKQLGTIEQTSMEDTAFKDYKDYFQWFLGAALFLLVIEFFFPERKFGKT